MSGQRLPAKLDFYTGPLSTGCGGAGLIYRMRTAI
jgi:hypothetical protein